MPARARGHAKIGKGGSQTQAVALKLLKKLPKKGYHLWMDNLFTSTRFLELLADQGYGGTRTCRTKCGLLKELIDMKASDSDDQIPWGTIKSLFTESGKVCQTAWKDNAVALIISNCFDASGLIERLHRRPKQTAS